MSAEYKDNKECEIKEDEVTPQESKNEEKADSKKRKKEEKAEARFEKEKIRIMEEMELLKDKVDQTNDKYIRLAAEFDNYRRRSAKERLDLISTAGEDVIKGFLPVLDDCERALQVLKQSDSSDAAIEGTELIYTKIMTFLKSRGLSVIEAVGMELDTDIHEAVAQFPVEEDEKKNRIIDVVQQGYKLNEKVIRYAKVVVGI